MKHRERGDFAAAWGGIASLQLGLSAVWRGARARGLSLTRVVEWMAATPSRLVRLSGKGVIAPGYDADLVVFEPDTEWTVEGARLEHRHPMTPYEGLRLPGRVRTTYLRGESIYHDGIFAEPRGRVILRSSA
jgi:allantoinase